MCDVGMHRILYEKPCDRPLGVHRHQAWLVVVDGTELRDESGSIRTDLIDVSGEDDLPNDRAVPSIKVRLVGGFVCHRTNSSNFGSLAQTSNLTT